MRILRFFAVFAAQNDGGRRLVISSQPLRMTVHFFEIFAVANFAVIAVLLWPIRAPLTMLPRALWIFASGFVVQVAAGVAIRAVVEWRRGALAACAAAAPPPRWHA